MRMGEDSQTGQRPAAQKQATELVILMGSAEAQPTKRAVAGKPGQVSPGGVPRDPRAQKKKKEKRHNPPTARITKGRHPGDPDAGANPRHRSIIPPVPVLPGGLPQRLLEPRAPAVFPFFCARIAFAKNSRFKFLPARSALIAQPYPTCFCRVFHVYTFIRNCTGIPTLCLYWFCAISMIRMHA